LDRLRGGGLWLGRLRRRLGLGGLLSRGWLRRGTVIGMLTSGLDGLDRLDGPAGAARRGDAPEKNGAEESSCENGPSARSSDAGRGRLLVKCSSCHTFLQGSFAS
jgi:hypothetical protein